MLKKVLVMRKKEIVMKRWFLSLVWACFFIVQTFAAQAQQLLNRSASNTLVPELTDVKGNVVTLATASFPLEFGGYPQSAPPQFDETVIPGFSVSPHDRIVDSHGRRVVTPVGLVDTSSGAVLVPFRFDAVSAGAFSPDDSRYAFVAHASKKAVAVVDGVASKPYDVVRAPRFSADSKRVAFVAVQGKKELSYIDGTEGPAYDGVGGIAFDATGKHVAYVASTGKKVQLVVDGAVGPFHESIGFVAFDKADGAITYLAEDADQITVFHSDQALRRWPAPRNAVRRINKTLDRYAYSVKVGKQERLILDGVEQPLFDKIEEATFSPDGKHFAYVGKNAGKRTVVFDGKAQKPYDDIGSPLDEHGGCCP